MAYSDHFSIANLPYGIASTVGSAPREKAVVTRLGDKVIFLSDLSLDINEGAKAALGRVGTLMPSFESKDANMIIAHFK